MKPIHISGSHTRGKQTNTSFTVHYEVKSLEEMKAVGKFDHVCGSFQNDKLETENFITTDCVFMDCDNDHTENSDLWLTPDILHIRLEDVPFYYIFSRNHMRTKGTYSARPRFHVIFPLELPINDPEAVRMLKERLLSAIPEFDPKAKDTARKIYGVENPQGGAFEGSSPIDAWFSFPALHTKLHYLPEKEHSDGVIREGTRNATLFEAAMRFLGTYGEPKAKELFSQECAKCEPPLPQKEVQKIWKQAKGYSQNFNNPPQYEATTTPRKVFSHKSDDELSAKPKPIPYLIKGYIRQKGLHMLYGESGCGKGFCILDMLETIARPEISSWHGKPVKHGDVIYFCGESSDGLSARIKVWKNVRGIHEKGMAFEVIDEIFHINEPDKRSDFYIDNVIANIKALSSNPALVVIDPLNVYMDGDENSASDAGKFISACRKIINECGCSVLFVQHIGLASEAKNRARGSSAFYAGVDTAMQIKRDGDILTLSVTKSKESKIPPDLIFNLTEHVIDGWFDDDGEPVTSCTIELAEKLMQYRQAIFEEKKKPKLSEGQIFARRTYKECAKNFGRIVIDNEITGHELIYVDVEDWRKTFYTMSTADNDDKKRVAFNRAKKEMAEKTDTLQIHRDGEREYYCLDLSGNSDPAYRIEIRTAIKNRKDSRNDTEAGKTDTTHDIPF